MGPQHRTKALTEFWEMLGRPYEFVDVGSHNGVMLLLARGAGAALAVGLEVTKDTGAGCVFEQFCALGEKYGIPECTVANYFSTPVGPRCDGQEKLRSLPTLQAPGSMLPVGVFSFSAGMNPADRQHMFELVAGNAKVKAFMCCLGQAAGDPYPSTDAILDALNQAVATLPRFKLHKVLRVAMQGSQEKKRVAFFQRTVCLKW